MSLKLGVRFAFFEFARRFFLELDNRFGVRDGRWRYFPTCAGHANRADRRGGQPESSDQHGAGANRQSTAQSQRLSQRSSSQNTEQQHTVGADLEASVDPTEKAGGRYCLAQSDLVDAVDDKAAVNQLLGDQERSEERRVG